MQLRKTQNIYSVMVQKDPILRQQKVYLFFIIKLTRQSLAVTLHVGLMALQLPRAEPSVTFEFRQQFNSPRSHM